MVETETNYINDKNDIEVLEDAIASLLRQYNIFKNTDTNWALRAEGVLTEMGFLYSGLQKGGVSISGSKDALDLSLAAEKLVLEKTQVAQV